MKKFNYFYCIENKLNGKFYYGIHKTDSLEDDYMGSGKIIKLAIKKYGKDNFNKKIIILFNTYEEVLNYEKNIINDNLLKDPSCYNLKKGGVGGLGNNGKGKEWYKNHCSEAGKNCMKNSDYRNSVIKRQKENWKNIATHLGFKNKKHTIEAKKNIGEKNSLLQKGEKNSQFGTIWITDGIINKKIKKDELNLWISRNWKRGRI